MGNVYSETSAQPNIARTIFCFTVLGFVIYAASSTLWSIWEVIDLDFIHCNPNRTRDQAMEIIISSPIFGLVFALLCSEFSLIVGALIAWLSHRIWGYIPFYSLFVMLLLCSLAMYVQMCILFGGSPSELSSLSVGGILYEFRKIASIQMLALLGCWWCSNPRGKRTSTSQR